MPANMFGPTLPSVDKLSILGPTSGGRIDMLVSSFALAGLQINDDVYFGAFGTLTFETNAVAGLNVVDHFTITSTNVELVTEEGESTGLKLAALCRGACSCCFTCCFTHLAGVLAVPFSHSWTLWIHCCWHDH